MKSCRRWVAIESYEMFRSSHSYRVLIRLVSPNELGRPLLAASLGRTSDPWSPTVPAPRRVVQEVPRPTAERAEERQSTSEASGVNA